MAELLKRYTSLANALDTLRNSRLTLLDPATWKDKNDTRFLEMYKTRNSFSNIYAACFTHSGDTYHHWEVFARHNEGICIEIVRDKLIEIVDKVPGYHFGYMNYFSLYQIKKKDNI